MPTETIEHKSGAASIEAPATGSTDIMVDRNATGPRIDRGSKRAPNPRITRRQQLLIGVLGAVVVAAAVFGTPRIRFMLSTVSTDDAFVNGHVTFVAPRVHGEVARVLKGVFSELPEGLDVQQRIVLREPIAHVGPGYGFGIGRTS